MSWDARFLALAEFVSAWSKDPSTKTGCVIARPDRTVASLGYNGLPRGVTDYAERLNDRPTKYAMTAHAELNAILVARDRLDGGSLYCWPWPPCSQCAAAIIQAGIVRVVAPAPSDAQRERWGDSFRHGTVMFQEAGVELAVAEFAAYKTRCHTCGRGLIDHRAAPYPDDPRIDCGGDCLACQAWFERDLPDDVRARPPGPANPRSDGFEDLRIDALSTAEVD